MPWKIFLIHKKIINLDYICVHKNQVSLTCNLNVLSSSGPANPRVKVTLINKLNTGHSTKGNKQKSHLHNMQNFHMSQV